MHATYSLCGYLFVSSIHNSIVQSYIPETKMIHVLCYLTFNVLEIDDETFG